MNPMWRQRPAAWIARCVTTLAVLAASSWAPAQAQTAADIALWDANWAQYQALESVPLPARGYVAATQQISIVIQAPLKKVYRIYSDVNSALGLHPFLKSITPIRQLKVAGVPTYDFIAYEDIPLPDGSVYPGVTIAQQRFFPKQRYYEADSYDVPGIVTHQRITFARVRGGGTKVTETLTFEAPPQYIDQTVQGGVYAHTLVQQGLKARIESGDYADGEDDAD